MDLKELSSQLTKAAEQKVLKEKLEQDLNSTVKELLQKSADLDSLEKELHKEKVDVEKLERTSLTSLFYSVLGSREQQMDKERQELLAAQLRYQRMKFEVDALEQERASLQQKLADLKGADAEYKRLLEEKEQALRQSNPAVGRELMQLSEATAQARSELMEMNEAIWAGNNAMDGLDKVINSLKGAEGWGTWDLLGGGLLADLGKHSDIDAAREEINEVQARMSRFKRELADVQRSIDLRIDIGALDTFADFFFGGLIADWVVQSKIEDSLDRAEQARQLIGEAVKRIEAEKQTTGDKIMSLQGQHDQLIARS